MSVKKGNLFRCFNGCASDMYRQVFQFKNFKVVDLNDEHQVFFDRFFCYVV